MDGRAIVGQTPHPPNRPTSGCRPHFSARHHHCWPMSAKAAQFRPTLAPCRSALDPLGPHLSDFSQTRPNISQVWPEFEQCLATSADVGVVGSWNRPQIPAQTHIVCDAARNTGHCYAHRSEFQEYHRSASLGGPNLVDIGPYVFDLTRVAFGRLWANVGPFRPKLDSCL